jgi:hypothetical protein
MASERLRIKVSLACASAKTSRARLGSRIVISVMTVCMAAWVLERRSSGASARPAS